MDNKVFVSEQYTITDDGATLLKDGGIALGISNSGNSIEAELTRRVGAGTIYIIRNVPFDFIDARNPQCSSKRSAHLRGGDFYFDTVECKQKGL